MVENEAKLVLSSLRIGVLVENQNVKNTARQAVKPKKLSIFEQAAKSGLATVEFSSLLPSFSSKTDSRDIIKTLTRSGNSQLKLGQIKSLFDEFLTKESALNAVILLSLTCIGNKEQVKPSYSSASLYKPKFL